MAVIEAAVIGLIALILAPGYLFYFDVTPKLIILLAGAAVCACLWRGGRPERALSVVVLCTLVSLAVSTAVSSNPALSVFGSTWRRFGLVAQCAVLLLAWVAGANGDRGKITILRGIGLASGISALYGIAQYFGWDPLLPRALYHVGEGQWTIIRPPGTLGHGSYFATWLLVSGFLCLALSASDRSPNWRRLSYVCATLCAAAMVLTGTRAALLGLVAGGGVAAYQSGFRVSRRVVAAGILAVAAATAFYFSPPGWPLRSRTRWFKEDPWGGARPLLWRDSLRMAAHRLPAGFGPEVFTASFPHFESRELARAYPDFSHESPHNIFLDALVSQGLPGLACLVALCLFGLRSAWRGQQPWLAAALAGGLVAQQFTAFTIPTALLFYVTVALCASSEEVNAHTTEVRLVMFATAAVMLYCAVRFTAADRALELTRRGIDAHDLRAAAMHYRDYQQRRFPGACADLWYSRALLTIHAVLPAGQAALDATQTAEDPFNAWYNLAELYAVGNSAAETEASLRRAITANPNWFKPHWKLAQLLRLEGRTAEAAGEAAIACDLDAGKHPEVAGSLSGLLISRN